jgi:GNAT superfamily N-acetyltransferase
VPVPRHIDFTTVSGFADVRAIHELQAANLAAALEPDEIASQGFVTVRHELAVLQRMNEVAPAIVAKDGDRVVAYALVMPREFAADVPILKPLFETLETLSWKGVSLRVNPRWFVMGQICVAKAYRGSGIFDGLYRAMAEVCRDRYDFVVTEVAARNGRSLRAHARIGFQTLHVYADATTGEQWHVIVLELGTR